MADTELGAIIDALENGAAAVAVTLCRQRLQTHPDEPDTLILLALGTWRVGAQNEALEIYARLTRLYPDDGVHWRNFATALRSTGDLQAAARAYATAVKRLPDDAELLEAYGLLQVELDQPLEACATLLQAFEHAPESPSVRIHAAQACSVCRDPRAGDLLTPWRSWLPLEESLQIELAVVLSQEGEVFAAITVLEELIRRVPASASARLLLASAYERVNRVKDALAVLQAIVTIHGFDDEQVRQAVERLQAQLDIRTGRAGAARQALERMGPASSVDDAYWFWLAKACDKQGDTRAAMHALDKGHAVQLAGVRTTSPHAASAGILPNAAFRVSAAEYADWPRLRGPDAAQSPVFVVGFPRSGTTLLEQMLDAHPRLQSMDERPFLNMLANSLESTTGFVLPRDLGRLSQRDCDELRKGYLVYACAKVPRRWNARLVDKNPLHMLWLPMIHRLFPDAKIILALRHPCDVILSCYMQDFRSPTLAVACQSLGSLAHAYVAAMESWLYHVDVFKPDVFVSRYEDLVADTPRQTRAITAFLGLGDPAEMLQFAARAKEKGYIKTPSYTQVVEPVNTRGVGRWKRYQEYFEPVLPILRPMLAHWGYGTERDPVEAVPDEGQ